MKNLITFYHRCYNMTIYAAGYSRHVVIDIKNDKYDQ